LIATVLFDYFIHFKTIGTARPYYDIRAAVRDAVVRLSLFKLCFGLFVTIDGKNVPSSIVLLFVSM
jgi:hypothetical protein